MNRASWSIFSRVLAATAGGYGWVSLAMALMASTLSRLEVMAPANAVMLATMFSFALYVVVVLWVFSARSAWRAWSGLGVTAVLMSTVMFTY